MPTKSPNAYPRVMTVSPLHPNEVTSNIGCVIGVAQKLLEPSAAAISVTPIIAIEPSVTPLHGNNVKVPK